MAREARIERPSGSATAVVAGTLVAFGTLALVMAVAGAIGSRLGLRLDGVSTDRWRQAGIGGAAVATLVLFASFLFGGYTAGRMAARRGASHGVLVALMSAVLIGVVVVLAATWGDPGQVADQLRANGLPTRANAWSDIGLGAAIAWTLAMILGSVVGGRQGARWHQLVADAEQHDRVERSYRGDADIDLRHDEGPRPEDQPSVEEERELERTRGDQLY